MARLESRCLPQLLEPSGGGALAHSMQQIQNELQVVWCSGGMAGITPEQQMLAATAWAFSRELPGHTQWKNKEQQQLVCPAIPQDWMPTPTAWEHYTSIVPELCFRMDLQKFMFSQNLSWNSVFPICAQAQGIHQIFTFRTGTPRYVIYTTRATKGTLPEASPDELFAK